MNTLILVIAILVGVFSYKKRFEITYCISGLVALVYAIITFFTICILATANIADQKIELYQKRNEEIEETVGDIVSQYMNYESSTFSESKNAAEKSVDAIAYVLDYPELKSDSLVQKQIDMYISNKERITELEIYKIELSMEKFLLYFGK